MTARAVMGIYEFLREQFEAMGGDLRLNTKLTGLVTNSSGDVVGVRAADPVGAETYIKAKCGVLLATGGMGSNRAMLKKYIPTCAATCKFSTTGTQDSGEGILMGLGAGARFAGFNNYDRFDGGINGVDWNTYMYLSAVQISRQPWLGFEPMAFATLTRQEARKPYHEGGRHPGRASRTSGLRHLRQHLRGSRRYVQAGHVPLPH